MTEEHRKSVAASGGKTPRKAFGVSIRLIPIVMVAVMATLSVKANHLWQGLCGSIGRPSPAQANNSQAGQPAPAAPNGAKHAGQPAPAPPPTGPPCSSSQNPHDPTPPPPPRQAT